MRNKLTAFSIALLIAGVLVNAFFLASLSSKAKLSVFFFDSNVNKQTGCDFFALYLATKNFVSGQDIYMGDPQHLVVPCHYTYRYLPVGLVFGAPYIKAPPRTAYLFWVIMLELLVFVNVWLLFKVAPSARIFGFGAFGFLASSPLYLELYMGQYSLLQATFMFAAMVAYLRGREKSFAGYWCVTLCWKLNTWIAAPALIRHKKWGAMAIALGVILVTTIPYFLKHPEAWGMFVSQNFQADPELGMTNGNHGFVMLVLLLFSFAGAKTILWIVPGFIVLLTLFITFAGRRAHFVDLLCLWMAVYFLVYKHIWEHHYVMLIPVIVILAVRHKSPLLLIPGLLVALPTVYQMAVYSQWAPDWELIYHAIKPLAAVMTYVFAAFMCMRK